MVDASALAAVGGLDNYEAIGNLLGISTNAVLVIVVIVSIWILVWKGLALWKAANKKSPVWFIILLVVNTIGILEILYLFVFSKMSFKGKDKKKK